MLFNAQMYTFSQYTPN